MQHVKHGGGTQHPVKTGSVWDQDRQCLGSRQAASGIKTGSVWDQDRQRLGSRQAVSGIKTGSVWDQDRQCLGSTQAACSEDYLGFTV